MDLGLTRVTNVPQRSVNNGETGVERTDVIFQLLCESKTILQLKKNFGGGGERFWL